MSDHELGPFRNFNSVLPPRWAWQGGAEGKRELVSFFVTIGLILFPVVLFWLLARFV